MRRLRGLAGRLAVDRVQIDVSQPCSCFLDGGHDVLERLFGTIGRRHESDRGRLHHPLVERFRVKAGPDDQKQLGAPAALRRLDSDMSQRHLAAARKQPGRPLRRCALGPAARRPRCPSTTARRPTISCSANPSMITSCQRPNRAGGVDGCDGGSTHRTGTG